MKVIVILVMLLHCTDLEDERRPSVVNSPSLDSTGDYKQMKVQVITAVWSVQQTKHMVIGKSSSSSDIIPTTPRSSGSSATVTAMGNTTPTATATSPTEGLKKPIKSK